MLFTLLYYYLFGNNVMTIIYPIDNGHSDDALYLQQINKRSFMKYKHTNNINNKLYNIRIKMKVCIGHTEDGCNNRKRKENYKKTRRASMSWFIIRIVLIFFSGSLPPSFCLSLPLPVSLSYSLSSYISVSMTLLICLFLFLYLLLHHSLSLHIFSLSISFSVFSLSCPLSLSFSLSSLSLSLTLSTLQMWYLKQKYSSLLLLQ